MITLSVLAIFAAYAALAALVRRQLSGNTAAAFAGYWPCAVGAHRA